MNPLAVIGGQLLALIAQQCAHKEKPIVQTAMHDGLAVVHDVEGFGADLLSGRLNLQESTNLALGQWDRVKIILNTVIGEEEVAAEEQVNALQGDFIEVITKGFASLIP